jgi:hypothetical protein
VWSCQQLSIARACAAIVSRSNHLRDGPGDCCTANRAAPPRQQWVCFFYWRQCPHRRSQGNSEIVAPVERNSPPRTPFRSFYTTRVKGYPYWAPPAASNLGQLIPRFRASGIPGQRLIHRRNYANCRNSFPYAMIGPAKSTRRNYVHDLRRLDAATECGFCPQCRIRFIAELATRRVARESGLANRGDHNRDGQGAVSPTWRASAGSSRGSAHLRFRSRMLTRINCLRCMPSFSA